MQKHSRTAGTVSTSNVFTKRVYLAGFTLAALMYGCVFLWQPVGQGLIEPDGSAVSRGGFIAVSLLCPENRIASWFDNDRLPCGFSDRVPIAFASIVWLTLSALIGLPLVSPAFVRIRAWSSRNAILSEIPSVLNTYSCSPRAPGARCGDLKKSGAERIFTH